MKFRVGDRVSWNSEAGLVTGKIVRVVRSEIEFKTAFARRRTIRNTK
jgi:hypothetical protein